MNVGHQTKTHLLSYLCFVSTLFYFLLFILKNNFILHQPLLKVQRSFFSFYIILISSFCFNKKLNITPPAINASKKSGISSTQILSLFMFPTNLANPFVILLLFGSGLVIPHFLSTH